MKAAVVILVVFNMLLFAYFQLFAVSVSQTHIPLPELHPEQVKVLSEQELAALPEIEDAALVAKQSKN